MSKPKKTVIEYRNYELPINFPVLVLTGDRWYISDVKSGKPTVPRVNPVFGHIFS